MLLFFASPTPPTTHPARPPTPPRLPADVDDELEPQTLEPRAARAGDSTSLFIGGLARHRHSHWSGAIFQVLAPADQDDDVAHETTSFAKTKTTTARLAVAAPDDDDSTGRCPSPTTRSPTHPPARPVYNVSYPLASVHHTIPSPRIASHRIAICRIVLVFSFFLFPSHSSHL
jgi:hypothetical protein